MENIAENLKNISISVDGAIRRSKFGQSVKIIAVTKTFGPEIVLEALKLGIFCFGENKVQECKKKFIDILKDYPSTELHMIGRLQTNKVKDALKLFHTIQTIDREKLAQEIKNRLTDDSVTKNFFIQVNVGNEYQKSGINLNECNDFIKWCKIDLDLNIVGLMCIPPEKEDSGFYFDKLKTIADKNNITNLSMGMSSDYQDAIDKGSTHIRIGTLIFGKRNV